MGPFKHSAISVNTQPTGFGERARFRTLDPHEHHAQFRVIEPVEQIQPAKTVSVAIASALLRQVVLAVCPALALCFGSPWPGKHLIEPCSDVRMPD